MWMIVWSIGHKSPSDKIIHDRPEVTLQVAIRFTNNIIQEWLAYVKSQIDERAKKIRRIASLMSDTDDTDAIAAFKADMRLAREVKGSLEQERTDLRDKARRFAPDPCKGSEPS
jgi:hypothetical protein